MKKLLIYGASYPDIFNLIEDINADRESWEVIGVVDDVTPSGEFMGHPIVGGKAVLGDARYRECRFVNNVYARPADREKVADVIRNAGYSMPSMIHPSVTAHRTQIGEGVVVMEGVRLGARTVLGDQVAVRYNSIVNHDNVVEAYAFIGPGVTLCGHVRIGRAAYIGAGSVVRERLRIGAGAMVGLGAVVIRDVEPGVTVVGNPAHPKSN